MGHDKPINSSSFFDRLSFSSKEVIKILVVVVSFATGYWVLTNDVKKNSEAVKSNSINITALDKKIENKSINDRALTYKYSSAQKDRIDEMQKILIAQEKREARNEVHLQYISKSMDELKLSIKELQKKKP